MAHCQEFRTPHLFYLCFVFIALFSSLTQPQETSPPIVSTDPSYYYNLCAPTKCGNVSISYPFGLSTQCHLWPRKAICNDNTTFHWSNPSARNFDAHRVLSLNYTDYATVTNVLAPDSLFTCGTQISRPSYRIQVTTASFFGNYTLGTHFNCTAPIPPNQITGLQNASCLGCDGQDPYNFCYYAVGFRLRAPNCETFDAITPGGHPNATSLRNLRALLQLGFESKYSMTRECLGCQASGGRCGANPSSSSGAFICFCPSSAHSMN